MNAREYDLKRDALTRDVAERRDLIVQDRAEIGNLKKDIEDQKEQIREDIRELALLVKEERVDDGVRNTCAHCGLVEPDDEHHWWEVSVGHGMVEYWCDECTQSTKAH